MARIYDRNLNKAKGQVVSSSAFALLISEMVQYTQNRVNGLQDFERKLNDMGKKVGCRCAEILTWRLQSKRETRVIGILSFISSTLWQNLFGKAAETLEQSTTNEDECMDVL